MKTVLVTGASSGLGLHTAQQLAKAGFRVIGGARSFAGGDTVDGVERLPLDVTSDESAQTFVDEAIRMAGKIDAVVHCAGMLILGSAEELTSAEYFRVLDTDFVGMTRVNRALLPHLRQNGGGRILMFSSINGLLGIPFQSAYVAAKHAVEGYAECLEMEVRPYGIEVCLIEPGDHRSGSDAYRPHGKAMGESSPYAEHFRQTTGVIHHDETHGGDPDALGAKIAALLKQKRRLPLRKCIASPDQHLAVWLHRFGPARLNSKVLRGYYYRDKK